MTNKERAIKATEILSQLISAPSFSKEEEGAAAIIERVLLEEGYAVKRKGNNLWTFCKDYQEGRSTLMLNSHLDTVKPAQGWETDPFLPTIKEGKLFGLGSNDAGGPLVSLLMTFMASESLNLPYNRVFVASCEEEISGPNGIKQVLPELSMVSAGIVGEPTQMEMGIAEKGLMVLDCEVKGKAGHAARTGGVNAISLALREIEWFHSFQFPEESETLGPVKMTVTLIQAGTQHNVIPDTCTFVVDVRTNEKYQNAEALEIIRQHSKAKVEPRSLRMNSSGINSDHPIVQAAESLGIRCFGSPTTSDQALISDFPTVKMGPGDSNRSHTANEYIALQEIEGGIEGYLKLLNEIKM